MILLTRSGFCNALVTLSMLSPEKESANNLKPASQFVREEVKETIKHDPKMAGSILRLAFHDAAVRSKSSNPNMGGADGKSEYKMK